MAVTFLATLLGRKPDDSECREDILENARCKILRRRRSEFGRWVVNLPLIRDRVPARYRPALFFETFYNVGAGATMQLISRSRTQVTLTQTIQRQPYNLLRLFSVEGGPLLENTGPADEDFAFARAYTLSYQGGLAVSRALGRRGSANADYAYRRSHFSLRDRDVEWHQAGLSYTHGLAEGLALQVGYGFREVRYPSEAGGRRARIHYANVGIDYNRTLAFSRRTTLSFSTGTSAFVRERRTVYRLVGRARLNHELGRTWTAAVAYNRNVALIDTYVDDIDEPYYAYDALSTGLEGLITRRLQFRAVAQASLGRRGFSPEHRYDTYSATVGLNHAVSRYVAAGATYFYYQYDFGDNPLPLGLLSRAERQGVRVQVTLWAPLFYRAGRS